MLLLHAACFAKLHPNGVWSVLQMASQHTQGAKLRTPKGFNKLLAVNIGYGVDQHGQDATVSDRANCHGCRTIFRGVQRADQHNLTHDTCRKPQ